MSRFADHFPSGTHAERPAEATVPDGSIYSCTEHFLLYKMVSGAWTTWATLSDPSATAAAVETHRADATDIHGIADTSLLETQDGAQAKANGALSAANSYTDGAVAEAGVPLGGLPGQALVKASTTDRDVAWGDVAAGGGGGLFRGEWSAGTPGAQTIDWEGQTLPSGTTSSGTPVFVDIADPDTGTTKSLNIVADALPNVTDWVEFPITFTGTTTDALTVRHKIYTEQTYDYFTILVDGVEMFRNSGTKGTWETATITGIEPGSHSLRFAITKDSSSNFAPDNVDIGRITFPGELLTDPYGAGEYVVHNGKLWRSDWAENSIEPGVGGWTEVPIGSDPAEVALLEATDDAATVLAGKPVGTVVFRKA